MRALRVAVTLDPDGPLPIYLQISRAVAGAIRRGALRSGDALPGTRTLALELGVHRNTILAAFRELLAEGWVVSRAARGTFVADDLPAAPAGRGAPAAPPPRDPGYRVGGAFWRDPPPDYAPGSYVLVKGAPDLRLVPARALARAYRRALVRHGRELLAYRDPRGHEGLRTALAAMATHARGIAATPDDVLVTRGSQMALHLAAQALVEPGDTVAVEALGHPQVWAAFRLAGARLVSVPVDEKGMAVEALERLHARHPLRAVLVTPHHQFPTTAVMPLRRRLALLEFARRHGVAVIEDDYDHEFHYDGRSVLPLASADSGGVVIYIGTLSKILAPGLRTGFVVAPRRVVERMASIRTATDQQGDHVVEAALAELFETGEFGRHVRRARRAYHARRDAMVRALRRHLPGAVDFRVPEGGMAVWASVDPALDIDDWARAAAPLGVTFRSGRLYAFDGRPVSAMRLGFTCYTEPELDEAARRMARGLALVRRGGGPARTRPGRAPRASARTTGRRAAT